MTHAISSGSRGLSSAACVKQPASGPSVAASSKENTDLNGDRRKGQSGVSDVAVSAPEAKSVYVEFTEMASADFKSLGRSYQVLQTPT
jgi:hypothetical protein